MKLVTYENAGQMVPGLLLEGEVADTRAVAEMAGWLAIDVAALRSNRDVLGYGMAKINELTSVAQENLSQLRKSGAAFAVSSTRFGPPVPDPEKIICIGLNYHDHAEELGIAPPDAPIFFAKYANSLAGPADDILPPAHTDKLDYEAELAVVIGRRGRSISKDEALDYVAGAMVLNDVSARDLQMANQLWTGGKAIDTFAPCGPALVLGEAMGDLQNLGVQTRVNGDLLQDGTTAKLIFSVAEIIAFLSRIMTLEVGDIIATGTPAGVAAAHTPPRFLKEGDVVETCVEGVGCLRNTVGPAWGAPD
ncbi:fumarylacetoacetate hydrolase family protein [Pseudohalocynthiibacter aestuariivivens]|jgi:2-keto-4-pentenoate hydratase/2-oxohepta-3-ene-1,7-dioic acid hydratase in catechol pathway|uniref:Fumarylacetoacetate hydrolase family protein n=1 Tax=Pseudohalocynthiibacter aestuariivivens TaxID=1591409 RepID=A0ABV5JF83_9RHOB|nr:MULTISPECIES: fumarylacetoacetate hydrolase family protein [Pseudohalocynthiibacter]MBS9717837.1 fumarylacetoacetate hydrolase family protein [Pseudohalocynthiibacter aestuariivivens]MCK0103013.1 fumarylacetoacetate hydrolase family protein [Pseudohalocynthiibacter sp. F2068]